MPDREGFVHSNSGGNFPQSSEDLTHMVSVEEVGLSPVSQSQNDVSASMRSFSSLGEGHEVTVSKTLHDMSAQELLCLFTVELEDGSGWMISDEADGLNSTDSRRLIWRDTRDTPKKPLTKTILEKQDDGTQQETTYRNYYGAGLQLVTENEYGIDAVQLTSEHTEPEELRAILVKSLHSFFYASCRLDTDTYGSSLTHINFTPDVVYNASDETADRSEAG